MKVISPSPRKQPGFTLIEVLIAVLVTASGLLGLAKMQALAISTTKNTGTRSLMALQAQSLGAFMHANNVFWRQGNAPPVFTASGTTVSDPSGRLAGGIAGGCMTTCTPTQLAANDVQSWVEDLNAQFPDYAAKVSCTTALPVNCQIYLTWSEKVVAVNKTGDTGKANQVSTQSFSIFVKP